VELLLADDPSEANLPDKVSAFASLHITPQQHFW
jgi:hypothetical protein